MKARPSANRTFATKTVYSGIRRRCSSFRIQLRHLSPAPPMRCGRTAMRANITFGLGRRPSSAAMGTHRKPRFGQYSDETRIYGPAPRRLPRGAGRDGGSRLRSAPGGTNTRRVMVGGRWADSARAILRADDGGAICWNMQVSHGVELHPDQGRTSRELCRGIASLPRPRLCRGGRVNALKSTGNSTVRARQHRTDPAGNSR